MNLKYVNYILWASQTKRQYLFALELGNLGGVILQALRTRIIVHPRNIP